MHDVRELEFIYGSINTPDFPMSQLGSSESNIFDYVQHRSLYFPPLKGDVLLLGLSDFLTREKLVDCTKIP